MGDDRHENAARFRALHDEHIREVTAFCAHRVSPDRADDAVAETFLVEWRRIEEIPDGTAGLMWLYRGGVPGRR